MEKDTVRERPPHVADEPEQHYSLHDQERGMERVDIQRIENVYAYETKSLLVKPTLNGLLFSGSSTVASYQHSGCCTSYVRPFAQMSVYPKR